ncbi:hypothetical protein [Thiosulfativibrio zosterae]|uniref:hypothetical protein n=1 Tax=Thiosulfativibrio zosterae TaxID=2675053 RepID=UPI001565DAEE|nr:hypothetical protein [Thiosulfativibrio zosterae]
MNQFNNQLEICFRHFNKEDQVEPLMKNPSKLKPFTMLELMQTTVDTLMGHELNRQFAELKDCEIKNGSSYSLIDVYERCQL